MFFTQIYPLSSGSVPLPIPCYFLQRAQAQFSIDSQLGSGQPVPASISFLRFRQHYANHFPESLTWSYLQFCTPTFATHRQHFSFFLTSAWIIFLQLSTLTKRLATVLLPCSPAPLENPPTPPAPYCLDVKFLDNHAGIIWLSAPN